MRVRLLYDIFIVIGTRYAAVATGVHSSFREAVFRMVKRRDEFTPNMENNRIYNKINNGVYKDLAALMEPALRRSYDAVTGSINPAR